MWQRASKWYMAICLEGFGDNITSVIYSVFEDAYLLEFVAILISNYVIPQQHSHLEDHWNKSQWLVEYRVFQIQHNYDS